MSQAADIQEIRIVTGEGNSFVRETALKLADFMRGVAPGLDVQMANDNSMAGSSDQGKRLLVAIGENAVKDIEAGGSNGSLILTLAPRRTSLETIAKKHTVIAAIQFDQPLIRMLNLARLIGSDERPGRKDVVGIVVSPALQRYLAAAESAASERRQKLRIEVVDSEMAVGAAIARIVDEAGMVLTIPDPIVHTANTVQPILLLTYRAGIPVIGYSAAYLRAGAAVALFSTPEQLARQAAEAIGAYLAGKPLPKQQSPRYFTIGVNTTVARSLGVDLPRAEELEQKLRAMKE